jgi:hypothetical protein
MTRIFVLLAITLACTGCEKKSSPDAEKTAEGTPAAAAKPATAGKLASCNFIKSESVCREYGEANLEAAGEESLKDTCTNNHQGEFKLEACPADKRVGACATPEGTKVFYTEGPLPLSADDAQKSCKEGQPAGEWKTGA